jgi:transcriptional regulator with XRE-family HTH domain
VARTQRPRDRSPLKTQGEVFRHFRKKAGLKQAEVSIAMGKDKSFMCRVELGDRRVDIDEWLRLCEILHARPDTWLRRLQRESGHPVTPVRDVKRSPRPQARKAASKARRSPTRTRRSAR